MGDWKAWLDGAKPLTLPQVADEPIHDLSYSYFCSWIRREIKILVLSKKSLSVTVSRSNTPLREYTHCQVTGNSPGIKDSVQVGAQ